MKMLNEGIDVNPEDEYFDLVRLMFKRGKTKIVLTQLNREYKIGEKKYKQFDEGFMFHMHRTENNVIRGDFGTLVSQMEANQIVKGFELTDIITSMM